MNQKRLLKINKKARLDIAKVSNNKNANFSTLVTVFPNSLAPITTFISCSTLVSASPNTPILPSTSSSLLISVAISFPSSTSASITPNSVIAIGVLVPSCLFVSFYLPTTLLQFLSLQYKFIDLFYYH